MESLEFSEDEIRNQLAALGYFNVSEERMRQFRKGSLFEPKLYSKYVNLISYYDDCMISLLYIALGLDNYLSA